MEEHTLFEKNRQYLERRELGFEKFFERKLERESDSVIKVESYLTYDDQVGMYIEQDGRMVQLNSQYESEGYANEWADKMLEDEDFKYGDVIIVFGFGSGCYIKSLLQKLDDDVNVIVYEPCREVFLTCMEVIDFEDILGENVPLLVADINMKLLRRFQGEFVSIENQDRIVYFAIPNYARVFAQDYVEMFHEVERLRDLMLINWNTWEHMALENTSNTIRKLPYVKDLSSLTELCNALPENYPAVIVSAGPSLEKNIHLLRELKGHALLIVVDTALRRVLNEGVMPDIYVTVDAQKPPELFEHEQIPDIPVIMTHTGIPEILEKHRSKVYFTYNDDYIGRLILRNMDAMLSLGTGGSVSQSAFSLAVTAKMSPIVMIGQDLAYTNQRSHASGTFDDISIKVGEDKLIWVDDNYGGKVLTDNQMDLYRKWYEEMIALRVEGIRIINATEGGAKIKGTEVMTLREVIDKECGREMDFEGIVTSVGNMFTEEQQQSIVEELKRLPADLKNLQRMSSEAEDMYDRLAVLADRPTLDMKEVNGLMKKLNKLAEEMEHRNEYYLVDPYIKSKKREALTNMSVEADDVREDIRNVANRGKIIVSAIKEAVPELCPQVEEVLKQMD